MRRQRQLFLVGAPALIALSLAGPAAAGSISISILPVVELREGALSAQVKVSNVGDEAAQSVAAVLVFGEHKARGEIHPSLAPGAAMDATLSLAVGDLGTGRWPYQVAVDYTDTNQYPFQAIHLGLITVGSPPPVRMAVSEVKADPLSNAGTLLIRLKNLAGVVPGVAERRDPGGHRGDRAGAGREARRVGGAHRVGADRQPDGAGGQPLSGVRRGAVRRRRRPPGGGRAGDGL